jgi:hypothetical protein
LRPQISVAGTRLSEQPIHNSFGVCCAASSAKNVGFAAVWRAAQARLDSNRCGRFFMISPPEDPT